jgi:hypothetical protein
VIEPAAAAAASRVPAREMAVRSRLGFGKMRARMRELGEEGLLGSLGLGGFDSYPTVNRLGQTDFDFDMRPIQTIA